MAVVQLLANGLLQQLVQPIAYGAALGIHPLAGARAVAADGQEGPAELGDETVVRPGGVPPAARPAQ
jgi:hypothetical protein